MRLKNVSRFFRIFFFEPGRSQWLDVGAAQNGAHSAILQRNNGHNCSFLKPGRRLLEGLIKNSAKIQSFNFL